MSFRETCPACGCFLSIEEQDWGCGACGGDGFDDEMEDDGAYAEDDNE